MLFPIAIVGIVFGSALLLSKMIMDYKRDVARRAPSADLSLSASELRELINDAVDNAVSPVRERLNQLEGLRRLSAGPGGDEEDVVGMTPDDVSPETEIRRRTR